ncbi:hypothetical protein L6164_004686 [Bauhinia variegata]|uniref:Uncharacterized protein n=1 Tax=Bauhinia variegata TaxID=167791 RepID=A0ACB9PNV3_BAUVA|nr:hypothetical protein L6164_004686 [Bauhinia variegata]
MSSPTPILGGLSRCGRVLGPSLDKIIKNASWRKHSNLVASCKSTLEKLECLADSSSETQSPLFGFSSSDTQFVLQPILLSLDSASPKVVDPALECTFKLFSLGLFRGEIDCCDGDSASRTAIVYKIIDSVCKAGGLGDEAIELGVLRVLLSAVRSPAILIRADCLIHIVRTCYNIYLGGVNGTNQICAKSVLAQMLIIVFTRAEEDSMDASFKRVSVSELLEFTDKNLNEGNSVYFCQNYINESIAVSEGAPFSNYYNNNKNNNPSSLSPPVKLQNSSASELNTSKAADENSKDKEDNDEYENETGGGSSKIRQDGYLLFKNLCKLSMKFSSQQHPDDHILLRGKILSLELLKVVMDNGGSFWRVNERQVVLYSLLTNKLFFFFTF